MRTTYQDMYNNLLFCPESVRSYEIGWKGSLFDRRLTYAVDGLYSDYIDVQIPGSAGQIINGVQTFIGIISNAAKARIKGAEAEASAIVARDFAGDGSQLFVSGTLGYIDPKYVNFIGSTGVDVSAIRVF